MIVIYISGIDGCGKTTQSRLLVEWLQNKGYSAEYQWLRWEPSIRSALHRLRQLAGRSQKAAGSTSSNAPQQETENIDHARWTELKRALLSSTAIRQIWLSYATRDYYRSYRRACRNWDSDYVVLDRYLVDFVVDQSLNLSMDPGAFLAKTDDTILARMAKPEYSIFIDIPAEVGYARKLDGTPLEYLRDREKLYGDMPERNQVLHVNGEQPPRDIHEQITSWIEQKIGIRK